ncbi:MAG: hypothetical protein AAFP69_11640 [Planctomycetota bacterium]
MNTNFFSWIRDGVKQSVLLGVSDAIEEIGTPADTEELHPGVAGILSGNTEAGPKRGARGGSSRGTKKRLGRSLKEMDTADK